MCHFVAVFSIFLTALTAFDASAATHPLQLRVTGDANTCILTMNGELVTDSALRIFARTGESAALDTDLKTSYGCVGSTIVRLQGVGLKVLGVTVNGRSLVRFEGP